jgi:hypothetical protein
MTADEERMDMIKSSFEIVLERRSGGIGNEDNPEFLSLPPHTDLTRREVEILATEGSKFFQTKTGGEEELEDGGIALPFPLRSVRGSQQSLQFLGKQDFDLPLLFLETFHPVGRVDIQFLFLNQIPKKSPQNRQMMVLRAHGELLSPPRSKFMELLLEIPNDLLGEPFDVRDGQEGRGEV